MLQGRNVGYEHEIGSVGSNKSEQTFAHQIIMTSDVNRLKLYVIYNQREATADARRCGWQDRRRPAHCAELQVPQEAELRCGKPAAASRSARHECSTIACCSGGGLPGNSSSWRCSVA